jgi:hypothetical protein
MRFWRAISRGAVMCNVGRAITRAFTPAGTGALEADQVTAENASADATTAFTKAITDATQASLPVLDNPSALAANQDQMRKTMAQRGASFAFGGAPTASPPVATRVLSGS